MLQVLKKVGIALLCATAVMLAGVCLLIVLSIPSQQRKDREYEAKLRPSIVWVESFQQKKQRLPTNEEFEKSSPAPNNDMIELLRFDSVEPIFKAHGGGERKTDFAARIWRGEQWTVYFSWSRQFDIVEP